MYIIRIQLSASNSQGFGPNATATVVTLDIGKCCCYRLFVGSEIVTSHVVSIVDSLLI